MTPTFVYVISPDYEGEAYISILTLTRTEASIGRIIVYCVGENVSLRSLPYMDNVEVRHVDTLSQELFLINKSYVGEVNGNCVVLVDSDTIFVNSPDRILEKGEWDICARKESEHLDWKGWNALCKTLGAEGATYVNTGFVVFRNKANKKMREVWEGLFEKVMEKMKEDPHQGPHYGNNKRWSEQIAFSLALEERDLRLKEMCAQAHVYGWRTSPSDCDLRDTVLFHAGRNKLFRFLAEIEEGGYVDAGYRTLRELKRRHHAMCRFYCGVSRAKINAKKIARSIKKVTGTI